MHPLMAAVSMRTPERSCLALIRSAMGAGTARMSSRGPTRAVTEAPLDNELAATLSRMKPPPMMINLQRASMIRRIASASAYVRRVVTLLVEAAGMLNFRGRAPVASNSRS